MCWPNYWNWPIVLNDYSLKQYYMKQSIKSLFSKVFLVLLLSMTQLLTWAQDNTGGGSTNGSSHSVTTETSTTTWYAQPWVWVVGGVVLIILLVALLRGNSNSDTTRTTVIKTDRTDI
jgi:uncharacterized membrane protein